VPASGIVTYM